MGRLAEYLASRLAATGVEPVADPRADRPDPAGGGDLVGVRGAHADSGRRGGGLRAGGEPQHRVDGALEPKLRVDDLAVAAGAVAVAGEAAAPRAPSVPGIVLLAARGRPVDVPRAPILHSLGRL